MWGKIRIIEVQRFTPPEPSGGLERLFLPLRRQPYAMLLLSGGDLDCARYSLMGWDPFLVLTAKGRRVEVHRDGHTLAFTADPFSILEEILAALELPGDPPVDPFSGGGLGFLAYDLKSHLERLPTTASDDLGLPEMVVALPRRLVVHDRQQNLFHYLEIVYDPPGSPSPRHRHSSLAPPEILSRTLPPEDYHVGPLTSTFSREDYIQAVSRIREYIRQGDVYQVNLSQRFSFPFRGDPYGLFLQLFQRNPSPFYAYLNLGTFQILSTSMERFLYRREEFLETRPIKGTRPRGRTPAEDEAHRRELAESPKDDAELSMIVDLLRNDLGKVCQGKSVQVAEHKRLERYENVYHLVSIVTGRLQSTVSQMDILRATFPGGSITGCPKIRAMEIIDELEPVVRHVYTGAIGYLGLHRNLDLNIAIRTAIVSRGQMHFSVGGGVVYDSREEDEYEETLHKGRTLFNLIAAQAGDTTPSRREGA